MKSEFVIHALIVWQRKISHEIRSNSNLVFQEVEVYILQFQQHLDQQVKIKLNSTKKKLFNMRLHFLNVKPTKKNVKKSYSLNNMQCQRFNILQHHLVQHPSLSRYECKIVSAYLNKQLEEKKKKKDEIYLDHMFIC